MVLLGNLKEKIGMGRGVEEGRGIVAAMKEGGRGRRGGRSMGGAEGGEEGRERQVPEHKEEAKVLGCYNEESILA